MRKSVVLVLGILAITGFLLLHNQAFAGGLTPNIY